MDKKTSTVQHWFRKSPDRGKSLLLAVAVHAMLFFALFFAFQWKTHTEEVYAEVWASVPATGTDMRGAAVKAEPAPEPEPEPETAKPAEPEKAAPSPEPEPAKEEPAEVKKPDIALQKQKELEEKKKLEKQKLIEEQKKAEQQKKAEEAKRAAEAKAQMEKIKAAEAARIAETARRNAMNAVRNQELARVAGAKPSNTAAGVPTGDRTAQFQNLSGSVKASFIARVTACIRPNIIFTVPAGTSRGQYTASYIVRLMPTGDQIGAPKKLKGSGLPGYDEAVQRAIARCPRFPTVPGTPMPGELKLTFDPVDSSR